MIGLKTVGRIARWEFTTTVMRAGFLLALIGLPLAHLGIGALIGFSMLAATREMPSRPIAVVDSRHVLGDVTGRDVLMRDEASAMDALRSGQFDAVFVLDDQYPATGRVRSYTPPKA